MKTVKFDKERNSHMFKVVDQHGVKKTVLIIREIYTLKMASPVLGQ